MNRVEVYQKTKEFTKGKWSNIFVINLIYGIVRYVIQKFFTEGLPIDSLLEIVEENPEFVTSPEFIEMIQNSSKVSPIFTYIIGPLLGIFTIALAYVIMKAIRDDENIRLDAVFKVIKEKFVALLVLSYILFAINQIAVELLAVNPILSLIGVFLVPIITLMLSFSSYTIVDGGVNGAIDALKDSINLTKGHKMDLFMIKLNYAMKILSPLLIVIFTAFLIDSESAGLVVLGLLLMIMSLLMMLGLAIYYSPIMLVANAMAYTMVVKDDEDDIVSTIEKMVQETETQDLEVLDVEVVEVEVLDVEESDESDL